MTKKKIAISKSNTKFHNYVNWIEQTGYEYEILDWGKNNLIDLKNCSSLLLTGGADIFPEFYADWPERDENGAINGDFIPDRDGFEFRLYETAINMGMPVLAICRGMQLVNCKSNGSLLSDIETIRGTVHTKLPGGDDRYHEVSVKEGTLLKEIVGESRGTINSSHHQGIDRLGEGFKIAARSPDGIIEAIEPDNKNISPFLLGVQWHPERMKDMNSPFTRNILERFLNETEKS
jgi:putative glutamine amidotransferase